MIYTAIDQLIEYALQKGLVAAGDEIFCRNALLDALGIESYEPGQQGGALPPEDSLNILVDYAAENGTIGDSPSSRERFSTRLMGLLTPRPSEVQRIFSEKYAASPEAATDWFYEFCHDCEYISRSRTAQDIRYKAETAYGEMDITINLSKPEKDPRDIAAAKNRTAGTYPACLLCGENEGYAGNIGHPARQNLRIIPVKIGGEDWGFQYSPYVYYNEHCIVLSRRHTPIVIDEEVFGKLFDFVDVFPHYFVGSNADLPIVGGSILSHEHFQGGRNEFPMDRAELRQKLAFEDYPQVQAGIVKWPMPVIRLEGAKRESLCSLAGKILAAWRNYSDESVGVLAETKGEGHNTITPIAHKAGEKYRLDLVLRNNRTTADYPLGIFHPHQDKHNIKKENIGLIEVMGLAVLPARLKAEMELLKKIVLSDGNIGGNDITAKHAHWFESFRNNYKNITAETLDAILQNEIGKTFGAVLGDAGVFKDDKKGLTAFLRFVHGVGGK